VNESQISKGIFYHPSFTVYAIYSGLRTILNFLSGKITKSNLCFRKISNGTKDTFVGEKTGGTFYV
jgi:hypothetical protein